MAKNNTTLNIKEKEYTTSIDKFNTPIKLEGQKAIGVLLTRLLLMEPGTDRLHPDMGVGIRRYRYGMDIIDDIQNRIEDQIATYLNCFPSANINVEYTSKKSLFVQITIDDYVYVYDSDDFDKSLSINDLINAWPVFIKYNLYYKEDILIWEFP